MVEREGCVTGGVEVCVCVVWEEEFHGEGGLCSEEGLV